jgi:chain length determinant protein tyrosine kinase EpsG
MSADPSQPIPLGARVGAASAPLHAAGASAVPLRPGTPEGGGEPRTIGSIIQEAHPLSVEQVERILKHQREHGMRFGEAAVAMGLIQQDDVLWALSQQFQYPNALKQDLNRELVVANRPFTPQAEVFRSLRSQLVMRLAGQADAPRAVAVLSAGRGDGKSYVAANLAVAFSQLGGRTLLLDADMRHPRQHALFGVDNGSGLSSILSGRETARVVHPIAGLPSLYVLPVGTQPPNPLELVERPAFGLLVRDLVAKFDHVVVDTPAADCGADASVIAARCGAALLVARRGRSHLAGLQQLRDLLRLGPALTVGALLNEC